MQHKRELAALVLDSVDRLERWKINEPSLRRMKLMAQAGPGKIRKVTRKIDRATALLAESQEDLKDADLFDVKRVRQALKDALDVLAGAKFPPRHETVTGYVLAGTKFRPRETVTSYTERMEKWHEESVRQSSEPIDPKPDIAHMLVSYLQRVCELSAAQSRLVTMWIGNEYFEWGYRATSDTYGVQDCDAIRMMVARHRRTLSKKRT